MRTLQQPRDVNYFPPVGPPFPPIAWQRQRGLYETDIKILQKGDGPLAPLGRLVSIPDNNGFVTMFVTQFLLEAAELQPELAAPTGVIENAVNALLQHRDHNARSVNSDAPLYCFWSQKEKDGYYMSWPTNLAQPLAQAEFFANLAQRTPWVDPNNEALATALAGPSEGLRTFAIPPDFDDTFVVQALGARLTAQNKRYPRAAAVWTDHGGRPATEALVKYAYDPLSDDKQKNTIDPRTYYWLRDFIKDSLESAPVGSKPSLALATTWAQNLRESGIGWHHYESMPGGVNNVDGSVATNVLFGLTSATLLSDSKKSRALPTWFGAEAQKVYADTAKLVSWIVDRDLMADDVKSRAVLLYYPSKYDFFYFVARLSHLLDNPPRGISLPPFMARAKESLSASMRGAATKHLLRSIQCDGDLAFWEDKLSAHNDRLFATAAAVNALLDTWTSTATVTSRGLFHAPAKRLERRWVDGVPSEVVRAVHAATRFLLEHSDPRRPTFRPDNVFFSASTHAGLPMAFACNVRELADGRPIERGGPVPAATRVGAAHCHGVSGYVPPEAYERLQEDTDAFYSPSIKELGMDAEGAKDKPLPYWSSPAITYSLAALALSKAASLPA